MKAKFQTCDLKLIGFSSFIQEMVGTGLPYVGHLKITVFPGRKFIFSPTRFVWEWSTDAGMISKTLRLNCNSSARFSSSILFDQGFGRHQKMPAWWCEMLSMKISDKNEWFVQLSTTFIVSSKWPLPSKCQEGWKYKTKTGWDNFDFIRQF